MGHRVGSRLLASLALVSCFSVCLLVHQLGQDGADDDAPGYHHHQQQHVQHQLINNGNVEFESNQRHSHRYLLMAGAAPPANANNNQPSSFIDSAKNTSIINQTDGNNKRLPRMLIIGVRKGGTRALLEMLNLHPKIAMVPVEVHFFDKTENYRKGLDWYRSQMPASADGQLTVEKSPSYFVTPEVPERVWSMSPHVQLILIVRDPVTRLLSDFAQIEASRAAQGLPQRRFQDVALLPNGEVNTQNRALHISLYAKFLSRWLHVFPRRQLHIVDGDQLIRDPWPELQKVERFLGLEHLIRRDQFYFNATKGFYCLTDVVSPPSDSYAHNNDSSDESVQQQQQQSVQHHHHKCLAGSKGRRHPQVPDEVMTVLRQFFAPHNRKFFAMVGQDFNWPDQ